LPTKHGIDIVEQSGQTSGGGGDGGGDGGGSNVGV
jgi:hypothetical protein